MRLGVASSPTTKPRHMYLALYGLLIGFVGTMMFKFVDYFETNRSQARVLKAVIVLTGTLAILHQIQTLFGIAWF